MNQFINRVVGWVANEIIVKGLAENAAFQRFAVRTAASAENLTKNVKDAAAPLSESAEKKMSMPDSAQMTAQADNLRSKLVGAACPALSFQTMSHD